MLVPAPAEVDERRIEVQGVSDHDVEEPRVSGEDPFEQPLGGGLFPLAGPEQLDVQDQRQVLADQLADRRLVIVFGDRLPLDRDRAGLALRAAALAAGEQLVAVDRREVVALAVDQRLVPLEPMDDVAEESPQGLAVHQGIDAADGVDAGGLGAEEAPQPRGEAEVLLQAVEAAAAGGEEGQAPGEGRRGRDLRTGPGVGQAGEVLGESEDLLGVGAEPCHHGAGPSAPRRPAGQDLLLLLQEGLEVVLGDALDQALDPTAVVDPSAGRLVEGRRDVDADPPVARAGVEIEGRVLLARPGSGSRTCRRSDAGARATRGSGACRPGFGPRGSGRRAPGMSAGNEVS